MQQPCSVDQLAVAHRSPPPTAPTLPTASRTLKKSGLTCGTLAGPMYGLRNKDSGFGGCPAGPAALQHHNTNSLSEEICHPGALMRSVEVREFSDGVVRWAL